MDKQLRVRLKAKFYRMWDAQKKKLQKLNEKIKTLDGMLTDSKKRSVQLSQLLDEERDKHPHPSILSFVESPLITNDSPPLDGAFLEDFIEYKLMQGSEIERGHVQVACKCANCSAHFVFLTWFPSLVEQVFYCPDCGEYEAIQLSSRRSAKEIFQVCSGNGGTE